MARSLPFRLPHLGSRTRLILRYAGIALVSLIAFVIALQLTFPFGRVKDKVVEALSDKYDVTIGEVSGGLMPGRVYFKAVTLRSRPTSADEVATTFYIEQIQLDIGLLALIGGGASVDLDAKIGPGRIKGSLDYSKSATKVDMVGEDLPSASLPVREALGLPMSGKIRFAVQLDLPTDKAKSGKVGPNWLKAEGHFDLACPSGCTIGDGKSKLRPKLKNQRNQAFAEGGIDFGKVNVDTLFARVEIKNGKIDVTRFDTKSPDGDLKVELDIALNQDLNQSAVTGCLRFRVSDVLLKREPKTHAAISTTGAPLGPDNMFHIKLDGQLREVRRLGQVCTQPAGGADAPPPSRPNMTVTPEPQSLPLPTNVPTPTGPIAPSTGYGTPPGNPQGSVVPTMPAPQPVTPPPAAAPPQPGETPGTVVPSIPIEPMPHQTGEHQLQPQPGEVHQPQPGEAPPPPLPPGTVQQ